MTVSPQTATPNPSAVPEENPATGPDNEPDVNVPQGPQETNPDSDEDPDVPLDAAPGQMPYHDTEVGA